MCKIQRTYFVTYYFKTGGRIKQNFDVKRSMYSPQGLGVHVDN